MKIDCGYFYMCKLGNQGWCAFWTETDRRVESVPYFSDPNACKYFVNKILEERVNEEMEKVLDDVRRLDEEETIHPLPMEQQDS